MRLRSSLAILALLAGASLSFLRAADADGFVPLFNGKDLNGWVNVNCSPETWSVRDGMIASTGKPTGALRTERQYENFILELEWRHLTRGGNAGVFIWASPLAAPGVPFLRAVEVQVLDEGYGNTENYTTHGDVFPIHGATMKPFGPHRGMRSFPTERRSKPSPEWNHYRIECNAGVIRLSVNGKEVSGGEDCQWRKGYLGLESEGAPTEWRNLRIKELPSTGATPDQSAPEAQGHRPLYNGADLRGWKTATPERWQPSDWKLILKEGAAGEPLWTEADFGNCEVIVDVRLPENAKPGAASPALLFGGPGAEVARLEIADLQPGKWKRCVWTPTANTAGKPGDAKSASARGAIGLLDTGAGVEFANLYVRDLL